MYFWIVGIKKSFGAVSPKVNCWIGIGGSTVPLIRPEGKQYTERPNSKLTHFLWPMENVRLQVTMRMGARLLIRVQVIPNKVLRKKPLRTGTKAFQPCMLGASLGFTRPSVSTEPRG